VAIAYGISKEKVVMQVQLAHVINCNVARLQPRIDI